jgi:membrane-associated protease RseP (regulator of RpoE activity)
MEHDIMQPQPPLDEDLGFKVNLVKSTIQKYFIVNDIRYDKEAFAFFIQLDDRTLEENFDNLRRELLDLGYVPMLLKERPGYIVYVTHKPDRQFRSIYVNVAFLVATIITTIIAGMSFVSSYDDLSFWTLENAGRGALYFAAPLMFILGLHEMGHYFMARKHRVAASLPFFIPAPPILGTFGAFISLREPIHSKRALMDIGFAGPIVGFIAALFITVLGLQLSLMDPRPVGDDASAYWILGTPLIYQVLTIVVPTPDDILIHPTAFAGWVGFLVTFLNLLPAGQLDGGHIVRALFGNRSKFVGYVTIVAMLGISFYFNYYGWLVFIFFILLVLQHPPPLNDISPLPPDRWMVGASAFILMMVCFVPAPFMVSELEPGIDVSFEEPALNINLGESMNNTLVIVNTGNTRINVLVRLQSHKDHWNVTFEETLKYKEGSLWGQLEVNKDRSKNFTTTLNITVTPRNGTDLGQRDDLIFEVKYQEPGGKWKWYFPKFRVTAGWITPAEVSPNAYVEVGRVADIRVEFDNNIYHPSGEPVRFDLAIEAPSFLSYTLTNSSTTNLTSEQIGTMAPLDHILLGNNDSAELRLWLFAPEGTAEVPDRLAHLTVTVPDEPNATIPVIPILFDVRLAAYDVSIDADSPQYFDFGEEKSVGFTLESDSNVVVEVQLSYILEDTVNWTITSSKDVITMDPYEVDTFTLTIAAQGDAGTISTMEIEITYGPDLSKKASKIIQLAIAD